MSGGASWSLVFVQISTRTLSRTSSRNSISKAARHADDPRERSLSDLPEWCTTTRRTEASPQPVQSRDEGAHVLSVVLVPPEASGQSVNDN
jgi:hypothetical protein